MCQTLSPLPPNVLLIYFGFSECKILLYLTCDARIACNTHDTSNIGVFGADAYACVHNSLISRFLRDDMRLQCRAMREEERERERIIKLNDDRRRRCCWPAPFAAFAAFAVVLAGWSAHTVKQNHAQKHSANGSDLADSDPTITRRRPRAHPQSSERARSTTTRICCWSEHLPSVWARQK
jgi:hypothetical protein